MIRINKNLAIFSSLIFLLGITSFVSIQKLSPLISYAVYYCQSFIKSLSSPIPYYLAAFPFLFVFIVLLIAVLRLSTIYIKVHLLRKSLIGNVKSNTSFSMLLEKLQLVNKTYLIESEKQFAFCLGIRHPKIYISTSMVNVLTFQEVEAVLRHERYHLKNRDSLTMLIASIGESLLPFFPLISDFLHNYRIEREIKADAEAIRGLGDKKPLISVLKKLLDTPSVAVVTASSIACQDTLEPRINALVKKDFRFKQFKAKHIFTSICSFFVMVIITLAPVQAVEINHLGKDVMMICQNYSENILYSPMQ